MHNRNIRFLPIKTSRSAMNCVGNVRIRIFSGLYFRAFGLNKKIYRVYFWIESKCEDIHTRKSPSTDFFYLVMASLNFSFGVVVGRDFNYNLLGNNFPNG